jgi:CHASE3 domain sensor protein
MKILFPIVIIVAVMMAISIVFLWYLGMFSNYTIEEKIEGGYTVAGNEVIGPYSKIGKHIDAVDTKLKALGIFSSKGFGIYYDNPNSVPK